MQQHIGEGLAFPMGPPIEKAAYLASKSVTHKWTYVISQEEINNAELCI